MPDQTHLLLATSGAIAVIDYRNQEVARYIELRPTQDGVTTTRNLIARANPMIDLDPASDGSPSPPAAIDFVESMAVASIGIVATASGGYIDLWDCQTGRYLGSVANKNLKIERLTSSRDGSRLAYFQDKTLHIPDLSQVAVQQRPRSP